MVAIFGFQIETILAIFAQQDTLMHPTKFQVNWPFGSGEEAENRFEDNSHLSDFKIASWIPI